MHSIYERNFNLLNPVELALSCSLISLVSFQVRTASKSRASTIPISNNIPIPSKLNAKLERMPSCSVIDPGWFYCVFPEMYFYQNQCAGPSARAPNRHFKGISTKAKHQWTFQTNHGTPGLFISL
ncbi:hypothetical protein [Pedobacter sp. ok626]|uniref:hypothetical protein n=1 Tax=Pedobacter sp. ok626 TaxID=1761882 RepID=UPI000B81ECE8|nr:hypothetical protein [Pedobacter sp. ok626]